MSTNNFYSKSGKYYALDDESSEQFEDGGCVDDLIDSLAAAGLDVTKENESSNDRNYPGRVICSVELKTARDAIHAVSIIVWRSGYYSGSNLDYETRIYDSYSGEYNDLEYLTLEDVANACYETRDLTREQFNRYQAAGRIGYWSESDYTERITADVLPTPRQCQKILDDLMREVETLEQKINDALKEVTTPLEKIAQFSNGECIYKEVTR